MSKIGDKMWLLGLNGATTMKKADLIRDIKVSESTGYDFLEIWKPKLDTYLEDKKLANLVEVFTNSHVKPCSINSVEHVTFRTKEEFSDIRDELLRVAEIASRLGCKYIIVVPSPIPQSGCSPAEIQEESIRVLRELSKTVSKYNVGLAFEFIGESGYSVRNLEVCWKIVDKVSRNNVGLVIDAFHFYVGNSSINTIYKVNPSKISLFHINDCEDRPKEELRDEHRLLPGEGVVPLKEIVRSLRRIRYEGVVSVELFRPEYWQWEPKKIAFEAKEKTTAVLKLAFS